MTQLLPIRTYETACKLTGIIRDLIDYDNRDNYIPRYNYQMSDLCAALGLTQLRQLDWFVRRRREIAERYTRSLSILNLPSVILPQEYRDIKSAFFRYVIRHPRADEVIEQLNRKGIEAKKPVYKPLHRYLGLNPAGFPVSETSHRNTVSLPIYPSLTDKQLNYITDNLIKILKKLR